MKRFILSRAPIYAAIFLVLGASILIMSPNAFYWSDGSELRWCLRWTFFEFFIIFLIIFNQKGVRSRIPKLWQRILTVIILAFLAAAVATGPVLLINATFGVQKAIVLEGKVIEKRAASGRSKARVVFINSLGDRHRWPINRAAFDQLNVGDGIKIFARKGLLNIPYVDAASSYWQRINEEQYTGPRPKGTR